MGFVKLNSPSALGPSRLVEIHMVKGPDLASTLLDGRNPNKGPFGKS